jgi:hypothetical protein
VLTSLQSPRTFSITGELPRPATNGLPSFHLSAAGRCCDYRRAPARFSRRPLAVLLRARLRQQLQALFFTAVPLFICDTIVAELALAGRLRIAESGRRFWKAFGTDRGIGQVGDGETAALAPPGLCMLPGQGARHASVTY